MRIAGFRVFHYRLPLAEPLTLAGRIIREREGMLIRLDVDSGASGWGDVAPLPGFSREGFEDAATELTVLGERIRGAEFDSRRCDPESWQELGTRPSPSASVRFGIETALASLWAQVERGTGPDLSCFDGVVPVAGLLAGSGPRVLAQAGRMREAGYRAVKLKVGMQSVPEDVALTRAVRAVLGDGIALRLDANRGWGLEQAVRFGRALGAAGVEYLEEPLRDPSRQEEFFDATGIPVALDESLLELRPDDLERRGAVGAVVLKPTLLGGAESARRWIARALESNIRPVVSGCFESGIGILALARLAWSTTGDAVPAGLDTYRWLGADVVRPRIPIRSGALRWSDAQARNHRIDTARLREIRHE